jgi:catechol 2,3-dioxygenase-like lactoylglutathione lyase family enzyme
MLRVGTIVLNVKDAQRASQFWHQALGYAYRDGGYRADATPVLLSPVLSPPSAAIALDERDRTHLDLHVDSAAEQQAEVSRLLSLGAAQVDWIYPAGARFVVLADPEGNLFCVINTGRDLSVRLTEPGDRTTYSLQTVGS